jgi:hypothetical protein
MLAMVQTCRKGQATTTKKEVKKFRTTFSKLRLDEGSDNTIKLFTKTALKPPGRSHRGRDFQKASKKNYTGLQQGTKLSLAANLVPNSVCPVLSFPERFEPITAAAMCTVAINVLKPGAFNPESEYFVHLFNKIMSCAVYKWVLKSQLLDSGN